MTLAVSGLPGLWFSLIVHTAPRLGITVFPLDPTWDPDDFRRLLIQGRVDCLISAESRADASTSIRRLDPSALSMGGDWSGDSGAGLEPLKIGDIHAIVATGGATSGPKGVMLSGYNLSAASWASQDRLPLGPGDRWLDCLPLYHVGGLSILYRCAAAGAAVLLHDGFDPPRVWRDLNEFGVTHISLVPAMLDRLLDTANGRPCPLSCKVILVGGGFLHPRLAARALDSGWPLCVSYGLTESASQCATDCGSGAGKREGRVGRPLAGFEIGILEPDAEGVGRIRIGGPAVMAGYANEEGIRGIGLSEGRFLTSDLGRVDASGRLHVLGRADHILVSGGENVDPERVEARLCDYPGVIDVAVGARRDDVWGDKLVALVVGNVDLVALSAWARDRLRRGQRPREYRSVPVLPRNAMGKLDRRAVRQLAANVGED